MLESFDTKKLIIFSSVVAVVLGMGGFFLFRGATAPPLEKIALQFWGTFDDASFFSTAISEFETAHPNVSIVFRKVSYAEYERALINSFATQSGPDIFMLHHNWLPKHYRLTRPVPDKDPITKAPILTFKEYLDTFPDVTVADFTVDQTIFGVPLYIDTLALYYNKDMFNTAGITRPPATWEELATYLPLLTKFDSRGNILQSAIALGSAKNINRAPDILSLLMLQSGARMTNDDNTAVTFAEGIGGFEAGEQAVQFYTDFANYGKADRYTWNDQLEYSIDAFANGKTAMMLNYSHNLATIKAKNPRLNFGIARMPQPEGARERIDFANYWGLVVAQQSKYPVEAWQFLKHLTMTDAIVSYVNASQRPPARRDHIDSLRNNPEYGIFAPQALTAKSWYQIDSTKIDELFMALIEDVNYNRATIRGALDSVQNQINILMRASSQ